MPEGFRRSSAAGTGIRGVRTPSIAAVGPGSRLTPAAAADVLVLIAGFRYASPVRDRPEVSYAELEHETAEKLRIPRLVFVLGEETEGPRALLHDVEF
jgi:hypothetical protein